MYIENNSTPKNEPGYLIGIIAIGFLCVLLFSAYEAGVESGPIQPGLGSVLLGIYVMSWGVMFLLSYFFSHKSFFFQMLIWLCENFSFPASRKMAFFYFTLAFVLGGMAVLQGLEVL